MTKLIRDAWFSLPLNGRERTALVLMAIGMGYVVGSVNAAHSWAWDVLPSERMRLVRAEDDCKDGVLAVERVNSEFLVCIGEPK